MKIVYVYWYFYVKFNGFVVHDSAFWTYSCITYYQFFKLTKLLGGGGGGQNDMFAGGPGGGAPGSSRVFSK